MSRLLRSFAVCALAAIAAVFCPPAATAADDDCLAVAYTGENFGGDSWEIAETGEYDLDGGFELPNDSIRSLRVRPGYRVVMYQHAEFGGESASFDGDTPLFGPAWRAQASSLAVEAGGDANAEDAEKWLAAVNADGDAEGGTLGALSEPANAYVAIHLDDLAYASARLGHSFLLGELLGRRMERDDVLEALRRSPPAESVSLMREYRSDDFHGAVRLTRHGRKLLEFLPGGARAIEGDSGEYSPFGRFLTVRINREDDNLFFVNLSVESPFSTDLYFYASVATDGETLLVGSDAEELNRARKAFEDDEERAYIPRLSDRKSFIFVDDTGDEDGDFPFTEDLLRGLFLIRGTASEGMAAELSCDLSDGEIRLSLRHNLLDTFLGGWETPQAPIDPDDPGFGFGGGTPWLVGALGIGLDEDSFLELLTTIAGGDEDDAREFLERQGIDPAVAAAALRSFGFVLGGGYSFRRIGLNGGYVFLSGDADALRRCKPFIEQAISHSFYNIEATEREGWDLFFVPKVDEWEAELHERFGWGDAYFIGMQDGVLLAGALSDEHLLSKPDIDWTGPAGDDSTLRVSLFPGTLSSLLAGLKGPQLMAVRMGMEDQSMSRANAENIIRALIHCLEIEKATLDITGRDSAELAIDTRDVDYKTAWELLRLINTLSAMEY